METVKFTHLHVHTEYSLLDGAAPVKKLVAKAKKMNMDAIAITDHGYMYGVIDFYKAALEEGIKPIIGCEVYVAPRTRFDKEHGIDQKYNHLVLLCENEEGYKNLMKIVSAASIEGFYYKPRVDRELLEQNSGGLICLSACLAGEVPSKILDGDYEGAKQTALWYQNVFGKDNYFIEIQDHGLEEQRLTNPALIKLAREIGAKIVATNDMHYINKEDAKYQDVLMCIQMAKTVADTDRMKFETDEFYLKSGSVMRELFSYIPEAIENTNLIAERCNVKIDFDTIHLPAFDVGGEDSFEYLKSLCKSGLEKRYSPVTKRETDRLDYELGVIKSMGYVDYFLIVWDFIKYAKDNGIPVGPGRGSGAGSIVAYCLDITTIDPLKYNLIFERFLNPERISMPDIDTDFCIERRGEVIDYVTRKYGSDRVAQIITFGTLKARAAIRDVGRALDIPLSVVDKVAKLVPTDLKMTLEKALSISAELRGMYEQDEKIKELIDTAQAVEGLPRHSGVHAAGVVIGGEPLTNQVPLQLSKDAVTTQYYMDNLSDLGMLKMDFLGLRNLTLIKNTTDAIKKNKNKDVCLSSLTYDDKEVYDLISSGNTTGIFQLESGGMREFMKELRPSSLEDIIAGISLYRPGPMDQIPLYLKNKQNPDKITYKHPMLEEILNVTSGCIIYQEQVMQIAQKLAGYSLGKADLLRRAMSKKKHDVMEKERQNFIYGQTDEDGNVIIDGAVRRGVDEKTANSIYDEIIDFASYAFNKSHAAAYAVVAYQTAYLKAFYPSEYMAALISSTMSDTDKTVGYIFDAENMGIKVLPPDINRSYFDFTAQDDGNIRFGLEAVKNVGHKLLVQIADERSAHGPFVSFTDFCERMAGGDLNKRSLENLIRCGAFDSMGIKRSQLMAVYEQTVSNIAEGNKGVIEGQISLFDDFPSESIKKDSLPNIKEYSKRELLAMEKETIGLYLSGHPLDDFRSEIARFSNASVGKINAMAHMGEDGEYTAVSADFKDGDMVTIGGIITARRNRTTKSNAQMAILNFEDLTGSVEVIVFPKKYECYSSAMAEDSIVLLRARISIREDEAPKLILESVCSIEDAASQASESRLYIKLEKGKEDLWQEVKRKIEAFPGNVPVCIFFENTGQIKHVNKNLYCSGEEKLTQALGILLGKDCVKMK